jgi:hypothetical protein
VHQKSFAHSSLNQVFHVFASFSLYALYKYLCICTLLNSEYSNAVLNRYVLIYTACTTEFSISKIWLDFQRVYSIICALISGARSPHIYVRVYMRLIYYNGAHTVWQVGNRNRRARFANAHIRSVNFCSVEKFIETAAKCSLHIIKEPA